MKTNWDLTVFYKDFDDPEFKDDLARLPKEIDAFTAAIAAPAEDEVEKLVFAGSSGGSAVQPFRASEPDD